MNCCSHKHHHSHDERLNSDEYKSHTDPVCGMETPSDLFKVNYQNEIYFFCSDHCRAQFEGNPENYIAK